MKMVNNVIEYGAMQLIYEVYYMMQDVLGMEHDEMVQAFEDWNMTELYSLLIESTGNILKFPDRMAFPYFPRSGTV